jgi:FkbM family methyltransferase
VWFEIKYTSRRDNLGYLVSWILKEEPVRIIPILDRVIVILLRILYVGSYILLRVSLRLILGKKRRNRLLTERRLVFNHEFEIVPSFLWLNTIYFIFKYLRLGNRFLFKIMVPKYNYKVYCPVNKNDLINLSIREDEIIEKFCPEQGSVVIDVGAHLGRYTIIASKRVGPNGKVIAIEADPGNFNILKRNIKLNKLNNIISLNFAAYSKEAKLKLHLRNEGLSNTMYSTVMSNRFETGRFMEVKANTLDDLLELKGIHPEQINWIKIDVEGAELEVLKGASHILSISNNISLLIETHLLSGGITLYEPIRELLNMHGFKIDFEMVHESGERHIIAQKQNNRKETQLH